MAMRFLTFIMLICPALLCNANDKRLDEAFARLDSVVYRNAEFIKRKQQAIDNLHTALQSALLQEDRYMLAKQLYDEYLKFDSDSAMTYALLCHDIAGEMGRTDLMLQSDINTITIYVLSGRHTKALWLMDRIGPIERLPESLRPAFALTALESCIRINYFGVDVGDSLLSDKGVAWRNYSPYIRDKWQYYYIDALLNGTDHEKTLKDYLMYCRKPSVQAAMLYGALSNIYAGRGMEDESVLCRVHSAMNDVETANREAQSLMLLLGSPQVTCDNSRAFDYLMLCNENARAYKDSGRSLNVVTANADIVRSYKAELDRRSRFMQITIVLLTASVLLIFFLMRGIITKRRHEKELYEEQKRMNAVQKKLIAESKDLTRQLTDNNERLEAELEYRNANFMSAYRLVSRYMGEVQNFKKQAYNLLSAGNTDKAKKLLGSTSLPDEYLQAFYVHFDRAFLDTRPDFVERFNTLLRPEHQVSLPAPYTLTPSLRIYALVSMGITDSVTIADFLHYSQQTIYNYRLKMRHCTHDEIKDLAKAVGELYNKT